MFLESIDISHFRNLTDVHLEFSQGFNVFYGANAQGKSNLLEAIYTLAFLKGFRGDRLPDLIEFEASGTQISTLLNREGAQTRLSVAIDAKETRTRHAYVDGSPCSRARDYLGILRAILFVPMDVSIQQAAPQLRRSWLDKMVFNLKPAYLIDLEQYQKLIKQKAAVLRCEHPDPALLDVYDEQIMPIAQRIIGARYRYLQLLAPHITRVFGRIFDETFDCFPVYKSATRTEDIVFGHEPPAPLQAVLDGYRNHVSSSRHKEIARQQVAAGPHRDDWGFHLNGRQARYYASQGQQRTMSLALKIAEIECLKREANIEPVFLLDDVSSELDPVRHKRLFEYLHEISAQTFLTTTSRGHVPIENVARIFHVQNGSITLD